MKIVDITCQECGASYQMAESTTAKGRAGEQACTMCGGILAEWPAGGLKVFRLVVPVHHKDPGMTVEHSPCFSNCEPPSSSVANLAFSSEEVHA